MNMAFFVRKWDRDYLNGKLINKLFHSPHDPKHNIRLEFHDVPTYKETPVTYENFKSKYKHSLNHRGLKLSEYSLALKHYETLKTISKMDISYALVIEDDCVLIENFITRFKERSRGFPPDWDIYFLIVVLILVLELKVVLHKLKVLTLKK